MASLQQRSGSWRVIFRYRGSQHFVTVGEVDQVEAQGVKSRYESTVSGSIVARRQAIDDERSEQGSWELSSRLILAKRSDSICRNGAMGWQEMVVGLGSGPRRAAVVWFTAGVV